MSGRLGAHPRFAASSLCGSDALTYPFSEFHLMLSPQGAGTAIYRNGYPEGGPGVQVLILWLQWDYS